ncbi:hypothetical protein B0H14DRAFT_2725576 [Mycena olivaceomarginata]|nr:hypothetical protein B0H14DRAFT_2725576 [Mycena olivaceomarginata]
MWPVMAHHLSAEQLNINSLFTAAASTPPHSCTPAWLATSFAGSLPPPLSTQSALAVRSGLPPPASHVLYGFISRSFCCCRRRGLQSVGEEMTGNHCLSTPNLKVIVGHMTVERFGPNFVPMYYGQCRAETLGRTRTLGVTMRTTGGNQNTYRRGSLALTLHASGIRLVFV